MAQGTMVDSITSTTAESTYGSQKATTAVRRMSMLQLLNLSIGFLGIQFAWAIQMGQMSPLLERLGSDPQWIGIISCAGPVTGVLVQPIIGSLSDQSKIAFGRRRPFLLAGMICTILSLILMPNSTELWMAAVLLWILDASINVSQGPYRAMISDVVPKAQQATAFSLTSLTIGLGSVIAFLIGFAINSMHNLFYLGASAMLVAMMWTILTTKEENPKLLALSGEQATESTGNFFINMFKGIFSMPKEGLKLCLAHSFTWFGLMCLFVFFSVYVPHHVFGAADSSSELYQKAVQWGSICYAVLNAVCFLFSFAISKLCALTSKKAVHTFGLLCMAGSMLGMFYISTPEMAMVLMGLMGIGWATSLSIPFALLSEHIPNGKEGVLQGTFNIFVAAPGVISSLVVGNIVQAYDGNYAVAMVIGGGSMLVAALLLQFVKEARQEKAPLIA